MEHFSFTFPKRDVNFKTGYQITTTAGVSNTNPSRGHILMGNVSQGHSFKKRLCGPQCIKIMSYLVQKLAVFDHFMYFNHQISDFGGLKESHGLYLPLRSATCGPRAACLTPLYYSVLQRFRQAKFAFSGLVLSSSQFLLLPQLPQKMKLTI